MQDPLFTASNVLNCNIDSGEVKAVVMKSKQRKYPGTDLLLNEVSKKNAVIEGLHKMFLLCLDPGEDSPCLL